MDRMTAKEFLLQPARARVHLEMALLRRDALKSLTERVTQTFGIQTTGGHSQNCNAMEDAVIRLTEAEEMVERRMEELAKADGAGHDSGSDALRIYGETVSVIKVYSGSG